MEPDVFQDRQPFASPGRGHDVLTRGRPDKLIVLIGRSPWNPATSSKAGRVNLINVSILDAKLVSDPVQATNQTDIDEVDYGLNRLSNLCLQAVPEPTNTIDACMERIDKSIHYAIFQTIKNASQEIPHRGCLVLDLLPDIRNDFLDPRKRRTEVYFNPALYRLKNYLDAEPHDIELVVYGLPDFIPRGAKECDPASDPRD